MKFSCHLYIVTLDRGLRTKTGKANWKIDVYSYCIHMVITAIIFT